jgi:hypothetical protein
MSGLQFSPINCYAIRFPGVVKRYRPDFAPTLTEEDWNRLHPETDLDEWIAFLANNESNPHYWELDAEVKAILSAS